MLCLFDAMQSEKVAEKSKKNKTGAATAVRHHTCAFIEQTFIPLGVSSVTLPQWSFTFVILNAPPYPDMGRETKANYILNFFIYYMSCSFSIFYARHRNYYLKGMPGNYLTTIISRMSAWICCLSLFSPSLPPRLGALAGSQAGGSSTTTVESPSGGVLPQLHTYART